MAEQLDSVIKSGICWFELSIERGKGGLELFVRADPRIEEFMVSLSAGKNDIIDIYGKSWFPIGERDIKVYRVETELSSLDDAPKRYLICRPAENLEFPRNDQVNLSFLRFVGIGSPEGVRFGIAGPFSKEYVRKLSSTILTEVRNLVKEFIVPININLRISSQEI